MTQGFLNLKGVWCTEGALKQDEQSACIRKFLTHHNEGSAESQTRLDSMAFSL